MKNCKYVFAFVLFGCLTKAEAQVNYLDPSYTWTELRSGFFDVTTRYKLDTTDYIFNNEHYHELIWSEYESADVWNHTGKYIRSADHKMYLLEENDEEILFDFTRDVSEELYYPYGHASSVRVVEIDSMTLLNGERRKLMKVVCEPPVDTAYWIEGLMSLRGLLLYDICYPFEDNNPLVMCLHRNDTLLYKLPYVDSCWVPRESDAPFLDPKYLWTEKETCFGLPPWAASYRFKVDTTPIVVEGKLFYEVLKSPTQTGDNFETSWRYISGLDSGKVYSYDGFQIKLLFDYNLLEGDTFYTHNDYDCKVIVGDIDTITLLNGEEKRKWILYESGQDYHPEWEAGYYYWLEGIGGSGGLFGNEQFCQIDGCGSNLLCVHKDDELIFNAWPANDSCWYVTAIHDPGINHIDVHPNPVLDFVDIIDPDNQINHWSLWSANGNVMHTGSEKSLDMTFIPAGLYIVKFQLKNGISINKRLIKI